MKCAIYPGSFDPPTIGHLDIIQRLHPFFDKIYVAIGKNSEKTTSLFSVKERISLLEMIVKSFSNIKVISFDGLLVDCVADLSVDVVIRSIRNSSDFEFEAALSSLNHRMTGIETFFIMALPMLRDISSGLIREIGAAGRSLCGFVPDEIENLVRKRLEEVHVISKSR